MFDEHFLSRFPSMPLIPLPSRLEKGACHGPIFTQINLGLSYTSG